MLPEAGSKGRALTTKGQKETFEDDEKILQFDCSDSYMIVWLIKTHKMYI